MARLFRILSCRPLFYLALFAVTGIILFSRCANQGMPTGGPKDSIPPFLVETSPSMMGLNFSGKEVRLTFNEYVVPDAVAEELVVSPPLSKRPSVRTKSRSLIVAFNEVLKPDVTYSLDFKNSVSDNNERNPYPGLRLLFSTGNAIDTLRVAGMVKDAGNLDPKVKTTVMLYSNLDDTAVYRSRPDYIARTDLRGLFLFDNVKQGTYHLFALNDANSNLRYDAGAEEFAFADSLIIPSADYKADPDTLAIGADSLLISGHTLFKPDPVYLRTFTEKTFDQYIDKSVRDSRYKCTFVFGESVKDTINIHLLNQNTRGWYLLEFNPEVDSLTMWVTDTLVARMDTLKLVLEYYQLDSLRQKFLEKDTLSLVYTDKERQEMRRRKKEEDTPVVTQFSFSDNIKTTGFDLNIPILLKAPEPVKSFDFLGIRVIKTEDLTRMPLRIAVREDTTDWRSYRIDYPWEANTGYTLEIDSAACENIYGITSQKTQKQFTTQKEDYYGRIILNLSSVKNQVLIQLLDNSKEEKLLRTMVAGKNGKYIFDFLSPAKYKIKIIYDTNNNGIRDEGNYGRRLQPERVAYLSEIVKVRSNWDNSFDWDLKPDPTFRKIIIDKEEEELKAKQLKEQQRLQKEREGEQGGEQTRESPGNNSRGTFGQPGNLR